jgi:hypothetical protein
VPVDPPLCTLSIEVLVRNEPTPSRSRIVLNLDDTLPEFDLRPLTGVSISFSGFYTLGRDGTMGPAPKDRADASGELAIEWAVNLSNNLVVCHQGRWLITGSH